jgi:hypothetical protein
VDDPLGGNRLTTAKFVILDEQGAVAGAEELIEEPQSGHAAAEDDDVDIKDYRHLRSIWLAPGAVKEHLPGRARFEPVNECIWRTYCIGRAGNLDCGRLGRRDK